MGRKTGANASVQIELGNIAYPMAALSSVTSPAADVDKKFLTAAQFISDLAALQAEVRVDGVISGFGLSPGSGYNEVDIAAGTMFLKGDLVSVSGDTITGITRPTTIGHVLVTALTVDADGIITATPATAGEAKTTRGVGGGPPFLPLDEVLIGYVTATYYNGSASGEKVLTIGEIDTYSKEYAAIPSAKVVHHDKNYNVGIIQLANTLPKIHAATAAGPGTATRNVYASYCEPEFEEIPDAKDFSYTEDMSTYTSKAYKDAFEEKAIGTPSWSASFNAYWTTVDDILALVKNSKRWMKHFPDDNLAPYWAGLAIVKVNRSTPVEDNMTADITLDGSGELFSKSS